MALSRRSLLTTTAVAAAVGIPGVQHLSWSNRSFKREGFSEAPLTPPEGRRSWSNWSGIEHASPRAIAVPADDAELAELIRSSSGNIRPVGTGHSFTGLVPSDGTIVDVSRFTGLISHDPVAMTATFGAGTRLRAASRALSEVGLGFPNMPDIDVQTLAGSFATATHGAGAQLTAIHDYAVGFRLITAAGDIMDVTETSHPELFAAGKVSLGALGVITQYTLRVVPAFKLLRTVTVMTIEDIMDQALAAANAHRGYEFFYLPNTGYGAVLVHDLSDEPDTGAISDDEDETMVALKEARDALGWWPWLRRTLVANGLPRGEIERRVGESWRLLSTVRPIRFNEMEYHLPLDNGIDTLREVVRRIDARKDMYFPIEVRFVAPDPAWLSPFNEGPCLSIAVHAAHDERFDFFYEAFEPLYLAAGGRPHWGKLHSRTHADLVNMYPQFNDFTALRQQLDPNGKFLNSHLRTLFGIAS